MEGMRASYSENPMIDHVLVPYICMTHVGCLGVFGVRVLCAEVTGRRDTDGGVQTPDVQRREGVGPEGVLRGMSRLEGANRVAL